ncbi:hypothetical protein [Pseudoduganella sp. UC29_71]|uniref:hypothetical protein n=1 Tax=Pseudoduganella sp. UC29_71 TaxID=3350174 RepID=UPI00367352FE
MTSVRTIDFDLSIVFVRAAYAAVRGALAETHGNAFAQAFLNEHMDAIQRAAWRRLNGCRDQEVLQALAVLRRIG